MNLPYLRVRVRVPRATAVSAVGLVMKTSGSSPHVAAAVLAGERGSLRIRTQLVEGGEGGVGALERRGRGRCEEGGGERKEEGERRRDTGKESEEEEEGKREGERREAWEVGGGGGGGQDKGEKEKCRGE